MKVSVFLCTRIWLRATTYLFKGLLWGEIPRGGKGVPTGLPCKHTAAGRSSPSSSRGWRTWRLPGALATIQDGVVSAGMKGWVIFASCFHHHDLMVTPYRWGWGRGGGGAQVCLRRKPEQLFEDLEVFKSHPFLPVSKLGFWGMIADTPQKAAAARF